MANVFVSVGSNKGNRLEFINLSFEKINKNIGIILQKSSIWESESWNYSDNDYLNAVIKVKTSLSANDFLTKCQEIEIKLGRNTKTIIQKGKAIYYSRTIDIDILFYDDLIIDTKELTIPHPCLQYRLFVLKPMLEIAPNFIHPILKKDITSLLDVCNDIGDIKLFFKKSK